MTRWSLRALCLFSTVLAWCQLCARAYLVNPWTAKEWASGFYTNKCHPIPKNMTLCYGIGYDLMRLPNLLNHESVDEAVQQSNIWNLLDKTKCHGDLRIFLCSLYAPVCLKNDRDRSRQIIKPCRSLCRVVRDNCLPRMRRFGYEWPAIARCDKFPDEKRNNLCIPARQLQREAKPTCRACDQAITYENIISSFCMANIVLKGKMKSHRVAPNEYLFNIHKKRRFFRSMGISSDEKRSIGGQLKRSNGCVCPQLAQARRHDKWLIMGRRDPATRRIDIVFLTQWQRQNRPFKKATRAIRKQKDICRRQQYSYMSNVDLNLPQRPVNRREKGNGRRRKPIVESGQYESRQDHRSNLQLFEGPTQWAPPRLSGRRNDLMARHFAELTPKVRPQQPPPVQRPNKPPQERAKKPPQQRPTPAETPIRLPSLQRPSKQSQPPPSQRPTSAKAPQNPAKERPTARSRLPNQRTVLPISPAPTKTKPRRKKGRKKQRGGGSKNRDGKKRKNRKNRKQRGGKRRNNRKGGRRKGGKRRGQKAGGNEKERKRKRKRKKKLRRSYFQQYHVLASSAR